MHNNFAFPSILIHLFFIWRDIQSFFHFEISYLLALLFGTTLISDLIQFSSVHEKWACK